IVPVVEQHLHPTGATLDRPLERAWSDPLHEMPLNPRVDLRPLVEPGEMAEKNPSLVALVKPCSASHRTNKIVPRDGALLLKRLFLFLFRRIPLVGRLLRTQLAAPRLLLRLHAIIRRLTR